MINVLFFAEVRERLGTASLTLDTHYQDVAALRDALAARDERWARALAPGKLLAAVNQTLVAPDHPLNAGDEVAFFPPVTGG
ncbi:molybdopterin synthase sulfur carrier subunit [Erwinia sp. OLTSP20]|uniref:molybdopterin synthase sulfur carrier subunit n=1 Tax=unclassified Erwinia TaxID=2622719 RepID=UPI000C1916B5|nr:MULTISPECIES: molybdopterin synthase sulfur carrier subunit [unclassified Erwinia]PIJ48718.1 molybdopterin synthase sulfur carrier subunit [Erwinia sp. OAMSP11]PIJ69341.1 molybdopterin synthase sulfur carrier subunit [Erwinia sp. OLSSP12]PIJ79175.1 molybdopterin synthase sulfur carrier subunit [Erwinia sp. OLCASP19]PIJ80701.1 molybdopterin synthase sulfur carrier subunit [Erwinia sp. OLMTSP26]PIJ82851.1 molybdopterin synthase sulfur carrier subunit [Erwinia sp. OLMDSP33]